MSVLYTPSLPDPERLQRIVQRILDDPGLTGMTVDKQGRYLHWHDLRYKTPPPGLDSEDYWWCVKLARRGAYRTLPLRDRNGKPFRFCMVDALQAFLHDLDLSGDEFVPAMHRRYSSNALMEEATHSSLLEGAATTRKEALKMLRAQRAPRTQGERMVAGNYIGMEQAQALAVGGEPLTVETICALHRTLTEHTMPAKDCGRMRDCDADDKDFGVYDPMENRMVYRPPPWRLLPARMQALCDFANAPRDDEDFLHPALRAMILHFMLSHEHPFLDGNGRTARALFYWSILKSGYPSLQYVAISEVLCHAPRQYGRVFQEVESDDNDLTYFLLHHAKVIQKATAAFRQHATHRQTRTREVREAMAAYAAPVPLNERQLELLSHAADHPDNTYTIQDHRSRHGVTYQTARSDLLDLASRGLLLQRKAGKMFVFDVPGDLGEKLRAMSGGGGGREGLLLGSGAAAVRP